MHNLPSALSKPAPRIEKSILAEKLSNHLRETPLGRVGIQLLEISAVVFLAWILIDYRSGMMAIFSIVKAGNYAAVKMAIAFLFVKRWRIILRLSKRFIRRIRSGKTRIGKSEKIIHGIPSSELVDYLVRNRHFRREGINGVRATFGLHMDKFNALAAELDNAGLFVRGENNSRVLDNKWSRQTLTELFEQQESSEKIKPVFSVNHFQKEGKVRLNREEIFTE